MTERGVTESVVEEAALGWLEAIGWRVARGPDVVPDTPGAERDDYGQVVLSRRLRDALARLSPELPADALDDAFRKLTRPEGTDLMQRNRAVHRLLVDGVTVEYRDREGTIRGAQAWVIDFDDPTGNDWLAVNQFAVAEAASGKTHPDRRPDVVVFVNGLPLAVLELKNPADTLATLKKAHGQLQTYKQGMPDLFLWNALLVVSDGNEARLGTISSDWERFARATSNVPFVAIAQGRNRFDFGEIGIRKVAIGLALYLAFLLVPLLLAIIAFLLGLHCYLRGAALSAARGSLEKRAACICSSALRGPRTS